MAYLAIYRKYRPRNFDQVVGQDYVIRILKNQILSDRIGHAYLFSGIRGTGKTSIAKIFARAINCIHNTDGNPCNECEVCKEIENPGLMDIIEIDAASNRGVDEIRDIRENVKYPPKIGKYKVYIIDEVHMMTKEAFNALLKTLEEPPKHAVFILATTEPNKLPATILSRCQRYDIKPISREMLVAQMQFITDDLSVRIEPGALDIIARRGDHSMRDCLSILDQIIDIRQGDETITEKDVIAFLGLSENETLFALADALIRRDSGDVVEHLSAAQKKGVDSLLLTDQLIDFLRDLLIIKMVDANADRILALTSAELAERETLCNQVTQQQLFKMIDSLIEDRQKLRYSRLTSVVLEMALLKLCMKPEDQEKTITSVSSEKSTVPISARKPAAKKVETESVEAVPVIKEQPSKTVAESPQPTVPATEEAKPAESTGQIDLEKVFQAIRSSIGPIRSRFLSAGKLKQPSENKILLEFCGEDNQAAYNFIRSEKTKIENVLKQSFGNDMTFECRYIDPSWEEMNFEEKTKKLANAMNVKVRQTTK